MRNEESFDIAAAGKSAAKSAGLRYVDDRRPGISRIRQGKDLRYRGPDGRRIRDGETLTRIRSLAVPPAWRDVWICPDPSGHLQCYVHPEVVHAYLDGTLAAILNKKAGCELRSKLRYLSPEEAAVLALLQRGLEQDARLAAA